MRLGQNHKTNEFNTAETAVMIAAATIGLFIAGFVLATIFLG